MERSIDPLLTIDAKLWADEFMATKQRLGDAEFDHAMMLSWFANAIMRGYDAGRDSMTPTPPSPDSQATIAALQARVQELEDDRSAWKEIAQDWSAAAKLAEQPEKFYEGYSAAVMNAMQALLTKARAQLTQRTAELEAAKADFVDASTDRDDWITSWRVLQRHNERIEAELERVRAALERIARYGNDGICPFGCDTPHIAQAALTATSQPVRQKRSYSHHPAFDEYGEHR